MTYILQPGDPFSPAFWILPQDNIRQQVDVWVDTSRRAQVRPWEDGMLWPNSRMMGGDPSASLYLTGQDANTINRYESMSNQRDASGGQQTQKIKGTTRDSSGNVLGSVTVLLFRSSDNLYVSQCTSDGGGYFEAPTPYPSTNHYIVTFKAGTPVGGRSDVTLQGV